MYYGIGEQVSSDQVSANASNIRTGSNPSFQMADFLAIYPQFGKTSDNKEVVPSVVIQMYIDLAQTSIKQARFRAAWPIVMAYFVAHFCTLWLRSSAMPDDGKDTIIDAGYTEGIITSSSVDGVSYSMDISSSAVDLDGYAAWKSTSFGIQLATMSKLYGKGGMVVT